MARARWRAVWVGAVAGCLSVGPLWAQAQYPETDVELSAILSYMDLSEVESNILAAQKRIERQPQNASAHLELAKLYMQQNKLLDAEQAFEKARQLRLSDRQWAVPVGRLYLKRYKYVQLLDEIQVNDPWLSEDLWAQEVTTLRGHAYQALGLLDKAQEAYEQVVQVNPAFGEAWFGLAETMFHQKADATQILRAIHQAESAGFQDEAAIAELSALVYHQSGRTAEAAEAFERKARSGKRNSAHLLLAHLALLEDDFSAFFEHSEKLYQTMPNNPRVKYLYALALTEVGQSVDAEKLFADLVEEEPENILAYFLLSKTYFENKNYSLASITLGKLEQMQPDNPHAVFFHTLALLKLGKSEQARERIVELMKKSPNDFRLKGLMASSFLIEGRYDVSLRYLQKAAAQATEEGLAARSFVIRGREGDLANYLDLERNLNIDSQDLVRFDAVKALFATAAYQHSVADRAASDDMLASKQDPMSNYLYGYVLKRSGDLDRALPYLRMATVGAPNFADAHRVIADAYIGLEDYEAAETHVKSVLDIEPDNVSAMLLYANLNERRHEHAHTISWLKAAIDRSPNSPEPAVALVAYYSKQDMKTEALALAKQMHEKFPRVIQFLHDIARLSFDLAQYAQAEQAYRELEKHLPGAPMVMQGLVKAQSAQQDYATASDTLDKMLASSPEDISLLMQRAQLAYAQKDHELVISISKKVLEQQPAHIQALTLIGQTHMRQERPHNALRFFELAYEAEPTSDLAKTLFLVRKTLEDKKGAFEGLSQWVEQHPQDLQTRRYLAEQYMHIGDTYEAILGYERILLDDNEDIVALKNLAALYMQYDSRRALDFAQRAYRLSPDEPKIVDTLGWAMLQVGKAQKGYDYLVEAYEASPNDTTIRYHLGVAKHKLGDLRGAEEDLDYVIRHSRSSQEVGQAEHLLENLHTDPQHDTGIRL